MNKLEKMLGYTFRDKELLMTALTHSSYANENKRTSSASNERLEFLGDSILGMTVADYLYRNEPDMPEGQMTRLRAELVCEKRLEGVAGELALGGVLRLGRGEEQGGGRTRPSILADAVEAVLAAIYLDGGIEPARTVINKYILSQIGRRESVGFDYKTALQELVQSKSGQTLSYHLTEESGPDHAKEFLVEVRLNGVKQGEGIGRNKKEAEQAAAKAALEAKASPGTKAAPQAKAAPEAKVAPEATL